jgi:hypothetical protein
MTSSVDLNILTRLVGLYGFLTILFIGILANVLNICVCLMKKTRNTAMGFYNLITATFNLAFLGVIILQTSFVNSFNWTCVLVPYLARIVYQMISWLNVMVSFDRLFLSYNTQQSSVQSQNGDNNLNRKKLILIVIVIFTALLCVNISGLFYHLETQSTNQVDKN